MSAHPTSEHGSEKKHGFSIVHYLEGGDGIAHILVALLLLCLALCILGYGTYGFVQDLLHGTQPDDFPERALTYLSSLLFGVVVLELLSTILTYVQARNLEATIKDFLIVALISSIRKILLVGAQSSIKPEGGPGGFVTEAMGTVVSIIGILLLIGGLLLLDKRAKAKGLEAAASMSVTADLEEQPT
jgi:uncharacterized membrane protein (DUF373 family)